MTLVSPLPILLTLQYTSIFLNYYLPETPTLLWSHCCFSTTFWIFSLLQSFSLVIQGYLSSSSTKASNFYVGLLLINIKHDLLIPAFYLPLSLYPCTYLLTKISYFYLNLISLSSPNTNPFFSIRPTQSSCYMFFLKFCSIYYAHNPFGT